ncbi:MAG: carbamoyl transferase [Bacteroidia bacterium]|nr:carbamoyl transferase [Bacteroidia bacterium]
MYTLGINGGVRLGYQDISAVLLKDGEIVAAVEEERLNRIKHSYGQLPEHAIHSVLKTAGITLRDIQAVGSHGSTWGDAYQEVLESYFDEVFGIRPRITRYHHHDCHAASAYYASGFDQAMVITLDNSGDGSSTSFSVGKGQELTLLERLSKPHSLGLYYSMITQFCGFNRDTDEYKLMGLSSYGDPLKYDFSWLLKWENDLFALDTSFLKEIPAGGSQPTRQQIMFGPNLPEKLGPVRRRKGPITRFYQDIAASAQHRLEEVLVQTVTALHERTGMRKLCLAGGVALNCAANRRLMQLPFIDDLYVQPASSDAGISLGAAYLAAREQGHTCQPMRTALLGPEFTNVEIKTALKTLGVPHKPCPDPAREAAVRVAKNEVVGWFQGRMEFGPRALGARSILANPTHPEMQSMVNLKIKFRETFRPFCPSVIEKDSPKYFKGRLKQAPYMTITYKVRKEARTQLPAITHVDGTARIQTVNKKQNPLYFRYLEHLKELIGHGVSLNTSFNRNSEPIVCTPIEAISAFYGSGMDALVIGNFVLEK